MTKSGKALVIGDDTRSFLATVRSLGRQGIEVHAAPFNMRAPALKSRYLCQVHLLPYYLDGGADWLQALQKLMLAEQFDVIIPCEERSLLPLYKHQHELPSTCALAIPSQCALEVFFDKLNTRQLAAQLGVPIAKGKLLLATDTADTVVAELTLPIIAKQRKSYSWPDLYVRTSVKILSSYSELDSWLGKQEKGLSNIFFEEMFAGRGLGVSVLCKQGVVLLAFEHHRAHELSGSSYYRRSAPLDAERLAAVTRMVEALEYSGVAMFEFKLNERTGEWILLEVNARPWGSLPLPVAVGADFPYLLYQMLVKGDLGEQRSYRVGVYGRNLVPDLWQLRARLQEFSPDRVRQLSYFSNWLVEFGRVLIGREHQDVMVLDDMRPGWSEFSQFFKEHFGARFGGTKGYRSASTPSFTAKVKAAQSEGRLAHVVFVCQGNICRSPYAELKAKKLFADHSDKLIFSSAGMLPRNSRPAPAMAIAAAMQHDIDLLPHQSKHAAEAMMRSATAIVIFDRTNYQSVLDRYPWASDRLYWIGEFLAGHDPVEVLDPEGHDLARFLSTYDRIDACLMSLRDAIHRGN